MSACRGGSDPASGGPRSISAICGERAPPARRKEAREDVREWVLQGRFREPVRSSGSSGGGAASSPPKVRSEARLVPVRGWRGGGGTRRLQPQQRERGAGRGGMRHSLSVPDLNPEPERSHEASAHAPGFATVLNNKPTNLINRSLNKQPSLTDRVVYVYTNSQTGQNRLSSPPARARPIMRVHGGAHAQKWPGNGSCRVSQLP